MPVGSLAMTGGPTPGRGLAMTAQARLAGRATLAISGGLLTSVGLPPQGSWWAPILGLAVMGAALRGLSTSGRAVMGALAGVIYFGVALWWTSDFHAVGYVVLVVLQAGFLALAAALVPSGPGLFVALPGAMVLAEAARARWPLGGLTLASPTLSQQPGLLLDLARLGGPLLVLLAMAALATALLWLVVTRTVRAGLAAGLVVLVVCAAVRATTVPTASGEAVEAAIVQGGGPRGIPAVRTDPSLVLDRHLRASRLVPEDSRLVLWPENVVNAEGRLADSPVRGRLSRLARRLGALLITGLVEGAGPGRFRNAAVAFDRTGTLTARYDKVLRVPFGEYVPARDLLARVVDLSLVPRDAVAGEGSAVLRTPLGPLGVAISYEALFPRRTRAAALAGGRILVVPTNAASYVRDEVPARQLAAARLRAVETGRSLLQAAPTGYSAIVAPDGEVLRRSGLGDAAVLVGTVETRTELTPYVRLGDLPAVLAAGLLVVAGWWARLRRGSTGATARLTSVDEAADP